MAAFYSADAQSGSQSNREPTERWSIARERQRQPGPNSAIHMPRAISQHGGD